MFHWCLRDTDRRTLVRPCLALVPFQNLDSRASYSWEITIIQHEEYLQV
jgi:hypothetical protein